MKLTRTKYRRLRMIPVAIGAIALGILIVDGPRTVTGQARGGLLPQSGMAAAPDDVEDLITTEAETGEAKETMVNIMDKSMGPNTGIGVTKSREKVVFDKVYKTRSRVDGTERWHYRANQVFQGIPVKGGHMLVAARAGLDPTTNVIAMDEAVRREEASPGSTADMAVVRDTYLRDPQVNTKPVITRDAALQAVRKLVRAEVARCATRRGGGRAASGPRGMEVKAQETERASLEIHPGNGAGQRKLTYHAVVSDTSTACPVQMHAWVGAQADVAGRVLETYNNIQTQAVDVAGTGRTFYQGTAPYFRVAFWNPFNVFVLNDLSLRIGTYDAYSSGSVYQASSGSSIFGNFTLADRNTTNADVMWSTVQTMSYFYWNHGRNYVDGNYGPKVYGAVDGAGPLLSAVNHVGTNYNNAYWDGEKINIGDGDGSNFRSLASLDIIGHEWTHGVTQFDAGLIYSGESGALNESFSDIFGAMTERYWKGERFIWCPFGVFTACSLTGQIGEDAFTPGIAGDALRYMYAPTRDGASRDHYALRYTGPADNGGVHWNSGIQNNAFWLLAYGGCHRFAGCMNVAPSVNGIGADAAKNIFYRALKDYMIPNDNFYWARYGTQYFAGALYGWSSPEYYATQRAWDLVGVPR